LFILSELPSVGFYCNPAKCVVPFQISTTLSISNSDQSSGNGNRERKKQIIERKEKRINDNLKINSRAVAIKFYIL
jgi:hypothetical protein